MVEFNQKEYQTVILAALLHDVGKLFNRPEAKTGHPKEGADFISRYNNEINSIGFDYELINNIIEKHHEKKDTPLTPIEDSHLRGLINIVRKSDNYACGERDYEEDTSATLYHPLAPVFAHVSLKEDTQVARDYGRDQYYYEINELDYADVFPSKYPGGDNKSFKEKVRAAYTRLQISFKVQFEELLKGSLSEPDEYRRRINFITSLYSILYKTTWSVPDDSKRAIRDISLFDHTRISAALSACLYIYHHENNTLNAYETIESDDESRFLLIAGDLSGIQDYLYDIANIGVGGVAKRLRTRSFFLSTLVEVTAHRILQECLGEDIELPHFCKIMASGGNFIIVAPKTSKIEGTLNTIRQDINRWLFKEFQGDLSFTISSLPLRGIDFEIKRTGEGKFSAHENHIVRKLNELRYELEINKKGKLKDILTTQDKQMVWSEAEFVWSAKEFTEGDCPSCKKQPAESYEDRLCKRCNEDRKVGEYLVKANYICYSKGGKSGDDGYDFFDGRYFVKLAKEKDYIPKGTYTVQSSNTNKVLYNEPFLFNPHAKYVSLFENKEDLDNYCKGHCDKEPSSNNCETYNCLLSLPGCKSKLSMSPANFPAKPAIKPFDCLAASSVGEKLLGILKADVDRLGLIFSEGMGEDRTSLSRIATLSRMLDLFFSGFIDHLLQNDSRFHEVYTVYSGGDDLLLVGPWDKIINLSKIISDKFHEYVAFNPEITMSAGISVTKPKFPIAKSSKLADVQLKKAKNGEDESNETRKNALFVFGTRAAWFSKNKVDVEISELLKWAEIFFDANNNNDKEQKLSTGQLYTLLKLSERCKRWISKRNIEDIKYLPLTAYIIGKMTEKNDIRYMLKELIVDLNKQNCFSKFRLPITHALLKSRKGGNKYGTNANGARRSSQS